MDPPPPTPPGRLSFGMALWGHRGWVGGFYPRGARPTDFLELYAARVNAVEGNTFFYAEQPPAVLERWVATTPPAFRILPKLPRDVTHDGPLVPRISLARAFLERLAPLGERLGPTFAQLPTTYGPEHEGDLLAFLEALRPAVAQLAVELRHPGWYAEPFARALDRALWERGVARVVLDTRGIHGPRAEGEPDPQLDHPRRKPPVPHHPVATADHAFVRFVAHPQLERNTAALDGWARRVQHWLAQGRDVAWFAHCPVEDRSPAVLRAFLTRLGELGVPVALWDEEPAAEQRQLF